MSLYEIKPTELINFDQDSLLTDIISRIKQHPQWSDNYNGLLHHDSLTMILSIYTFLFGKNAESFDKKIRENFITTARSDEAKAYSIRENNIQFKQNTESVVTLKATITNTTLSESIYIPVTSLIATGLNSKLINFEIINKENGVYNYRDDIVIDNGIDINSFLIDAYSGESFRYTYPIQEKREDFSITVPYSPIIQDSIQVYFYLNGAYFELLEGSLNNDKQTSEIFPDGIPKYSLTYTFDNKPIITFGKDNFGGTFKKAHSSGEIVIYGRTGGGSASNIPEGTLTQSITLEYNDKEYIIEFTNISQGTSGTDADSLDDVIKYAPLNRGRGKNVVDKCDAEEKIRNYVNKVLIEIPTYKEEQKNTIPLLHNYYYIVPKRNFSNFILTTPLITDDKDSYNETFIKELNLFCNVYGNHDSIITETENGFYNTDGIYNFTYLLNQRNVLSNSIIAKAYNNDILIDTISFEGNYPVLKTVNNKLVDNSATYKTPIFPTESIFIGTTVDNRENNRFQIMFDDHDYLFDINVFVGNGTYTYETLVETLNIAIKNLIEEDLTPTKLGYTHELYVVRTYQFVKYNTDNSLTFSSPKTGERSKVKFIGDAGTPQGNLLNDLGIIAGFYRAERSTLVFKGNDSIFDYDKDEILFSIDYEKMNKKQEETVNVIQSPSNPSGPILMFNLYDNILEQLYKVQNNSDLSVELWDGVVKRDEIIFKNLTSFSPLSSATQTANYTGNIIKAATDCKFNLDESLLTLTLKDPKEFQPYVAGYEETFGSIVLMTVYKVVGVNKTLVQSFTNDSSWNQLPNSALGTTINLPLSVSSILEIGQNYQIDIYTKLNNDPNILAESVTFSTITSTTTNGIGSSNDIINGIETSYYDRMNNMFVLKTVDGVVDADADPVYFADFQAFNKVVINFKAQTYDYITVDYKCDPYNPEGEALEIVNKISNKSVKLLGLENIIKDINFVPIGFEVDVYVATGFSKTIAREFVYGQIVNNFKYNNTFDNNTIDVMINNNYLSQIIMPYSGDFGITNVLLKNDSFSYMIPNNGLKNYYFVLDGELTSYLKSIETSNGQVVGLADFYKIKINVI